MAVARMQKRTLVNDDRSYTAASIDTGQNIAPALDTGQPRLEILSVDQHRVDTLADGTNEVVMSTLRKFSLRVGVCEQDGAVVSNEDGLKLNATLIADNGDVVTDLSQSCEPPLLGGEAIVDHGEASFELRITVLSSLCRGNKFRVLITAPDRPHLRVMSGPMRTITKLFRNPATRGKLQKTVAGEGSVIDAMLVAPTSPLMTEPITTEPIDAPLEWPTSLFEEFGPEMVNEAVTEVVATDAPKRTRDELWEEVTLNGNLILELQAKQAKLFEELRVAHSMTMLTPTATLSSPRSLKLGEKRIITADFAGEDTIGD